MEITFSRFRWSSQGRDGSAAVLIISTDNETNFCWNNFISFFINFHPKIWKRGNFSVAMQMFAILLYRSFCHNDPVQLKEEFH